MRRMTLGAACGLALALAGCGGSTDTRTPEELDAAQSAGQKVAEDDERQMLKDTQAKPKKSK